MCSMGRVSPTTVGLPSLSPGPGAELGHADPGEAFRRDARPPGRVHLAGVAETFGHREDGRQGDLGLLGTVVVLELEAQCGAEVLQVADPAGEGAIEQLGHLGAHLPRLPVDGVAAEQHEVEGTRGTQRGSERVCGGQRVRAGEHVVAEVQPRVGPPGHRLAQRVIGARWAEGHDRAGAPVACASVTPAETARRQYPFISRSTFAPNQPPALEAHRLGDRDLLDARCAAGLPARGLAGPGSRGLRSGHATGHGGDAPLAWGVSDRWPPPRGYAGRRPRASRRAPVPGLDRDDLGAPHRDGVEGADALVSGGHGQAAPRASPVAHRTRRPPGGRRPTRAGTARPKGRRA